MKEFDVVVIGGGTAGISAARAALEKGATVGLVEMNRLGGFALYPGMILLQMLRDATQRGASLEPLNTLKAQAAEQSQHALKGIEESLQSENIEYIQGKGRLGEGGRIQISHDGETTEWHARKTVIATGSLSKPISTLPFDNHQIQPVEHLLETLELPSVPLVVGGDRAALETAYLLKSLGSKVFLVNDQTRLLSGQDPDLSGALEQSFKKQKIKLLLGNRIVSILKEDRGIQLTLEGGIKFSAENIFISAERLGRTQDLGLREANVELGSNSEIWVNEQMETSRPGMYAAGSVTGRPHSREISNEEGRVAGINAAGGSVQIDRDRIPFLLKTQPEIATIGCRSEESHFKGWPSVEGKYKNASPESGEEAFPEICKIVANTDTRQVIGAQISGIRAIDSMNLVTAHMKNESGVKTLSQAIEGEKPPYALQVKKAARACSRALSAR